MLEPAPAGSLLRSASATSSWTSGAGRTRSRARIGYSTCSPTRPGGIYHYDRDAADERFSTQTWVQRDVCDRKPWPWPEDHFDFANCSHTLEDLRDPVWVCSELSRVAKAGYVEVPSRLEEQAWGVIGDHVGWSHHRWLVDIEG